MKAYFMDGSSGVVCEELESSRILVFPKHTHHCTSEVKNSPRTIRHL